MSLPSTLPELVAHLRATRADLAGSVRGMVSEINNLMIPPSGTVVVLRDADIVAAEQDLKDRAIQLVKDMGSTMADEQIWSILQTLPSKQINGRAKQLINSAPTQQQRIDRALAWTEIQAVREEAVVLFETTNGRSKPFSDPMFTSAEEERADRVRVRWHTQYMPGGRKVTPDDVTDPESGE